MLQFVIFLLIVARLYETEWMKETAFIVVSESTSHLFLRDSGNCFSVMDKRVFK